MENNFARLLDKIVKIRLISFVNDLKYEISFMTPSLKENSYGLYNLIIRSLLLIPIVSIVNNFDLAAQTQLEIIGNNLTDPVATIKAYIPPPGTLQNMIGLDVESKYYYSSNIGGIAARFEGGLRGIEGKSEHGIGVSGTSVADGTGVYGYSLSSYGIEARSHNNIGLIARSSNSRGALIMGNPNYADLVLGGNTDGTDDGTLISDYSLPSSDLNFISYDDLRIDLDENDDEEGTLTVVNSSDNIIFELDETGSISVGRNSHAPGTRSAALGNSAISTNYASIALGDNTTSSGFASLSTGGETTASGDYSTAMGHLINTNGKEGAFMIGDSDPNNEGETLSGTADQMVSRFWNGYFFMTSGTANRTGIRADHGANAWSSICDKNKKENFQILDNEEILEKLTSVQYQSWNYKGQDPAYFRHYGIMAQDFFRLFGQDEYGTIGNDTLVNAIDMMGIAMSGIKGLSIRTVKLNDIASLIQDQVEIQNKKLAEFSEENQMLRQRVADLEEQVNQLDQLKSEINTLKQAFSNQSRTPIHQTDATIR